MDFGDTFLANADLFPARQTGEPWGSDHVAIRFAGSRYVFAGLSATQARSIRSRFAALCDDGGGADEPTVNVQIFRTANDHFADSARTWAFDFDLDYADDAVRCAGFHFMGRLDWKPQLHAAVWTSEDARFVTHAIFENMLRLIAAYDLLAQGGVLLHSAAVGSASGAHVFFGPSGSGKSTISRLGLATGRVVLSDDLNALRVVDDGVFVESVPFTGDLAQSVGTAHSSYRALSLCRVERGRSVDIRPLRPALAIAALIGCSPFVNRDPYRAEKLFDNLQRVNARLPVQALASDAGRQVWDALQQRANCASHPARS
jgi:hypothetical protein